MTTSSQKNDKTPKEYMGFGYVDFPLGIDGWQDAELGICTVRAIAIDYFKKAPASTSSLPVAFDDVLIGTNIHADPAAAFELLQNMKDSIVEAQLLGHVNWVGVAATEHPTFWVSGVEDLTKTGKALYHKFSTRNVGNQILLLTSICKHRDTISLLTKETEAVKLPKLNCLMQ